MAMCPSHKQEFATDRMLWIERPGILAEPIADEDNPCWVCEGIAEAREAREKLEAEQKQEKREAQQKESLLDVFKKKLFS